LAVCQSTARSSGCVTCVQIEGAVHGVVLSARPVRKQVYDELGRWLGAYLSGQVRDRLL